MTPHRETEGSDGPAETRVDAPAPLVVACSLVGLEAAVLVLYGLSLIPSLSGERLAVGITSLAFLVAYGCFVGYCGWRLWRLASWARAPVVMVQLIQVPVGLSFWGGSTKPICVAALVVAVITLLGVFHPASLEALDES